MYHFLFIHSPTSGYLGCFHLSAVVNTGVCFTCGPKSFSHFPRSTHYVPVEERLPPPFSDT